MKKNLEEMEAIKGVKGAFLYLFDDEIVFNKQPEDIDLDVCREIAKDIIQVSGVFSRLGKGTEEFDLKFEQGSVLAYVKQTHCLVIICQADVSMSLLRLSANVLLADIEKDKKSAKRLSKVKNSSASYLIRSNMDGESWKLIEIVK